MRTVSFKISDDLFHQVAAATSGHGMQKSTLIRLALQQYLQGDAVRPLLGSFLDLAPDLCGVEAAPADLSTNPKHMERYGQ